MLTKTECCSSACCSIGPEMESLNLLLCSVGEQVYWWLHIISEVMYFLPSIAATSFVLIHS